MRNLSAAFVCVGLLLLARVPAISQVTQGVDFAIQEGGTFVPLPAAGAVTFQAPGIGQPVSARMRIRNTTTSGIRVERVTLQNSQFSLRDVPMLPVVLAPSQFVEFTVTYVAVNTMRSSGQIEVIYSDPSAGAAGSRLAVQAIAGTAPDIRLSYVTPEGNTLPLPDKGVIQFPPTQVNAASTVTVVIGNVGTSPVIVNSVTLSGTAYRLQSLPLFPSSVSAAGELRFNIRFAPTQTGAVTGTLRVGLADGEFTAALAGSGTSSSFSYELLLPDSTQTITPGSSVVLPETPVGTTTSVGIRVSNTGTGDGLVTAISVLGSSFQLSELPTLPASVPVQNSIVFILSFSPRDPGRHTGRLRIGNEILDIAGTATGSRLLYSYRLGDASVSLPPDGSVLFAPTQVGDTAALDFVIQNVGNRPANLANISLIQTGSSFSLNGLPGLPRQLQPEEILAFSLRFTPNALGQFAGSLRVNTDTLGVSGSATQPPPLPAYTLAGASGSVEQMQQPAISLALDTPYPLRLRGTLTLNFESVTFVVDPALQFSTGSRTVGFTIEAGSRQAVFSTGATNIRFQTGTVAGAVILTPSFLTADVDVTPPAPTSLRLTIAPAVPVLMNLQIGAISSSGVTFLLSGASNTRTLQSVEIDFTLNPGVSVVVRESKITVDVAALAETYYRSAASAPYGSILQASVPIAINASTATSPGLLDIFESATVTLVNSVGRSNSMSIRLR